MQDSLQKPGAYIYRWMRNAIHLAIFQIFIAGSPPKVCLQAE